MCHHERQQPLRHHLSSYADAFMYIDDDDNDNGSSSGGVKQIASKLSPSKNSSAGNNIIGSTAASSDLNGRASWHQLVHPNHHEIQRHCCAPIAKSGATAMIEHDEYETAAAGGSNNGSNKTTTAGNHKSTNNNNHFRGSLEPVDVDNNDSNSGSLNSAPVMTEEDINCLRESFNLVKNDAFDIGTLSVNHIFKNMPEARVRFCKNLGPASEGVSGNAWERMEQGFTFLSGIERCLLRLNRTDTFECYVDQLTTSHTSVYGIRAELIVQSLREFELVLLTFLQHIQHQQDLDVVLNTWRRFINLLCDAITAANLANQHRPSELH